MKKLGFAGKKGGEIKLSFQAGHGTELNRRVNRLKTLFEGLAAKAGLGQAQCDVTIGTMGPKGKVNQRGIKIQDSHSPHRLNGDVIIDDFRFRFFLVVRLGEKTVTNVCDRILQATNRQRFLTEQELHEALTERGNNLLEITMGDLDRSTEEKIAPAQLPHGKKHWVKKGKRRN